MSGDKPTVVLDTNYWLAFNLGGRPHSGEAREFLRLANLADVALCTPVTSLKDTYYILAHELKRAARENGETVDAACAAAIDEVARACVRNVLELTQVVPMGPGDAWESFCIRPGHADFEDDLVIACAKRCRADFIVTEDRGLSGGSPVPCLDICQALERIRCLCGPTG